MVHAMETEDVSWEEGMEKVGGPRARGMTRMII